jgi:hypothetical protein
MMETHQSNDEKLRLPDTILTCIISYLDDPQSLARAASVSRQFREIAYSDELWKTFVNSCLPTSIKSCKPAPSFRRLFIAFHPYWFIPKFRFWLSDEYPRGQLLIARFNPSPLCIEAWAVVADRENARYQPWSFDPEVMIHESDMRVRVDQQHPVFRFGVKDEDWNADDDDLGSRHVRAAMMCEESTAAAQSRMELTLGHTSTNTPIGGDFGMWPISDMSASTSIPRVSAGTSIPDSFDHQAPQQIVIPPLASITTALTRLSHTEQYRRTQPHPVLRSHGKASGAETTFTTAWSSCWCYSPIRLILINARACWQSS